MLSRQSVLRHHQSLVALYAKAATSCGNAVSLRKRLPRRESRSWLRQSSVSLVFVINICSGSANVPVNVEKMDASSPITPYFRELKGFFQPNPQQTTTSILRSRTQVLAGHLPVNSNQAKQHFLSSVSDLKGLLQVTELKLTNSSGTSTTALVLCDTACCNSWDPIVSQIGSVCRVPH